MNLRRSVLKLFASNIASSVVTFVGIALFARLLGATGIGIFFLFEAALGIFAIVSDFGVRDGVEKRISEGGDVGALFSSGVVLKSLFLTPFILGVLLFRGEFNQYIGAEVAVYFAVALVLREAAYLLIGVLRGELQVEETAVIRFSQHGVWFLTTLLLLYLGYDARGMILGLLAGLGAMLLIALYRVDLQIGTPSVEHMRTLFAYSKYSFVSSVGGTAYNWIDVLVIGFFLTQAAVGVYEVAWRVTMVVMLFSYALSTTIFPRISSWDAQDKQQLIESLIPKVLVLSFALTIPAVVGSSLLSKEILSVVFGPEYRTAWAVLIVLMVEKLFQAPHIVIGRSLQAIDRPDLGAKAAAVAMLLNLMLNVILVSLFGIIGAAIATTVAFSVNALLHALYLSRFVEIRFPYKEIAISGVATLGMACTLVVFKIVFPAGNPAGLAAAILLGALSYSVLLLSVEPMRTSLRDIRRDLGSL